MPVPQTPPPLPPKDDSWLEDMIKDLEDKEAEVEVDVLPNTTNVEFTTNTTEEETTGSETTTPASDD